MFRNYLTTAFRNLGKNKLYSGINIAGLTIGLAACLLIGLFISHELSYDRFHKKADSIVRVTMEYGNAGTISKTATTGTKVGPQFERMFPAVEAYTRTYIGHGIIKKAEKIFDEPRILYADSAFFSIFSFDMVEGHAADALNAPDKIVLTRTMAKKYFGEEAALHKTLSAFGKELTVSGVCEDAPENSQVKFDFVTRFTNLGNQVKEEKWWEANWITYLLVKDEKQIPVLQQQVEAYMKSKEVRAEARLEGNNYLTYHLEPLTRVHLYSALAGFEPNGNIRYIYMFAVIALLILIIASANYTNLATAQSTGRGNEIGVRKVAGASRKQVFFQFVGESALITFLSAGLAWLLGAWLIPYFNQVTGKEFTADMLLQPAPLLSLALIAVLVSFLAGFYPALVLSGARIIGVLKKGVQLSRGGGRLRQTLMVVQFGISVFLIIYTAVILQQMHYMQTKNLGYDKSHLVVLPIDGAIRNEFQLIKDAVSQVPGVEAITAAYETPEFVEWGDGIRVSDESGAKEISLNAMPVDLDFIRTMKMDLVAGRDFQPSDFSMMDTANDYAGFRQPFIINEALAKKIGWAPGNAIGKQLEKAFTGPVVGVVRDFNFSSLREPIGPLLIFLGRNYSRTFIVRINGKDIPATLGRLEMLWKQRIPSRPFNYHFLEEDYEKLYIGEQRTAKLFTIAAALAIILACLGLFGMAAFTVVQRTKEIGIRRVLGANIASVAMLVAKKFLIMVSVAIVLAVPLAWYVGHKWLEDFAFRIAISGWTFLVTALAVAGITLITVTWQALKAAMANPVKSLRTE